MATPNASLNLPMLQFSGFHIHVQSRLLLTTNVIGSASVSLGLINSGPETHSKDQPQTAEFQSFSSLLTTCFCTSSNPICNYWQVYLFHCPD